MSSRSEVAACLREVLETVPNRVARETGCIKRHGTVTGSSLVQTLVLDVLREPTATLEELAQMAAACGVSVSAQAIDQRFTTAFAATVQAVLDHAVEQIVTGERRLDLLVSSRMDAEIAKDIQGSSSHDAQSALLARLIGEMAVQCGAMWSLTRLPTSTMISVRCLESHAEMEGQAVDTSPSDEREQLDALYHLLIQARSGLEKIESDSDRSTAYMHARNARIDLNEALRRLGHVLGHPDAYPHAESGQAP